MNNFSEFWPYYLSQHQHLKCRLLHFWGLIISLIFFFAALITGRHILFVCAIVIGYGLSWIGHFVFEKNRPATLKYPFWSLLADFKMFFWMLKGKI